MKRNILIGILAVIILFIFMVSGCDKERIVESTEYIKEIEYVDSPPDTIFKVDTVYKSETDTVINYDTVFQINNIYDTVVQVNNYYDTVFAVDTILSVSYDPNKFLAFSALEYYSNFLVLDIVQAELWLTGGWIFYLTSYQADIVVVSNGVYDMYGLVDYWAEDWSGYYPLEFNWRMTYKSGDPADPKNWDIAEPPAPVSGKAPGITIKDKVVQSAIDMR